MLTWLLSGRYIILLCCVRQSAFRSNFWKKLYFPCTDYIGLRFFIFIFLGGRGGGTLNNWTPHWTMFWLFEWCEWSSAVGAYFRMKETDILESKSCLIFMVSILVKQIHTGRSCQDPSLKEKKRKKKTIFFVEKSDLERRKIATKPVI